MPPQRATFRHTRSATPAPAAPGSAAVSSIATGTGDSARTAPRAAIPWTGSSRELQPGGRQRAQVGQRLLGRAPGAVGVDPDRHVRPGRGAHRRDPPRVVPEPDLDLHAAEAGPRGGGRLRRGAGPVLGSERRVDGDGGGRGGREQRRDRPARPAARPVPQRQIDGGERLGQPPLRRACGQQLGVGVVGPGLGQHRAVGLQRRGDRPERHAVVGLQRRGLAAPLVPVAERERQLQQLALAQLAPRRPQRRAQRQPDAPDGRAAPSVRRAAGRRRAARRRPAAAARCPPAPG